MTRLTAFNHQPIEGRSMAKNNFTTCPHCGQSLFTPFENTAETPVYPRARGNAFQESVTNLTAAGIAFIGVGLIAYWYDLEMWLPASISVLTGLGLPVLKTILYAPPRPAPVEPQEKRIKVTMDTPLPSGNKIQLDENFGVEAHVLLYVAQKAVANNFQWARRKIKGGPCSQGDFEIITAALLKNFWAQYENPQHPTMGVRINRHGQAVLRAIAAQKL